MKNFVVLILMLMVLVFPLLSYAQENAFTKLINGTGEIAFSWVEVPKSVVHFSEKSNIVTGAIVGVGVGTALSVVKAGEGIITTALFPFPPYQTNFQIDKPLSWEGITRNLQEEDPCVKNQEGVFQKKGLFPWLKDLDQKFRKVCW